MNIDEYIRFDDINKQFTIPSGTYSYSDVVRVSGKWKFPPFRSKGCIKDETILAIYVSKEKTMVNTNQYIKDRKVAEKIKEVMKKKLNRF